MNQDSETKDNEKDDELPCKGSSEDLSLLSWAKAEEIANEIGAIPTIPADYSNFFARFYKVFAKVL